VWNWLGVDSIAPKLPALLRTHTSSATAITNMNGAPNACSRRIESTPRHTTTMLINQKPRKHAHNTPRFPSSDGRITISIASIALPPIHAWIPNHPQATIARSSAAKFAPRTPNDARSNTGNGIPYFAPACAFSNSGINTIRLPSSTVPIACFQSIPFAISPDANRYVVISMHIENHSAV
jgi:hypothetical protein